MPMFDFNCEICGTHRRVWRRADEPPRFCCRACQAVGLSGMSRRIVKYPITPEIHTRIWRVYHEITGNGKVTALAARLGYPKWVIIHYAIKQGWIARQKKEPDWSAREMQLLERFAHNSPEVIQRKLRIAGFRRSLTGIVLKKKRLRLAQNYDGQSARRLAECLGVDVHFVTTAIREGRLRAEKRGTHRLPTQGGDIWFIKDKWVRDFILTYPEFIDLRKVDKFWFIDLLAGNQRGEAAWGQAANRGSKGLKGEVEAGVY